MKEKHCVMTRILGMLHIISAMTRLSLQILFGLTYDPRIEANYLMFQLSIGLVLMGLSLTLNEKSNKTEVAIGLALSFGAGHIFPYDIF